MRLDADVARRPALLLKPGNPLTITPSGSPFAYTAVSTGAVYISGGTVSLAQLARGGVTVSTGLIAGGVWMQKGDILTTTYVVAPTMTWVPGG